MAGPVESELRARLRAGEVVSRAASIRRYGVVAGVILDGFVRRGAAERDGDSYAPIIRVIPEETIERVNAKVRELPGAPPVTAESLAAAELRRQEREALRAALAAAKTPADRERVVRESRSLARVQGAIEAAADIEIDASLFGIEMES